MNKIFLFFVLTFVCFLPGVSMPQGLSKSEVIHNEILHQDIEYSVYLPPNYTARKTYPVIFYLHPFGSDRHSADMLIKNIHEKIIEKTFPETIIIAPNAGKSWYIDDYAAKYPYASFFNKEFLPAMQKLYNISSKKNQRALFGISMGGFGALRFAMTIPNKFGVCVSLMGALMTKEQVATDEYYEVFHKGLYGEGLKGTNRVNKHFLSNNPLYMMEQMDSKKAAQIKWFLQCCDEDFHALPNRMLNELMLKKGIPHEYNTGAGDHNPQCYLPIIDQSITFITKVFTSSKKN